MLGKYAKEFIVDNKDTRKALNSLVFILSTSYHFYKFKNEKNTHGGVTFGKVAKWYQIAQC